MFKLNFNNFFVQDFLDEEELNELFLIFKEFINMKKEENHDDYFIVSMVNAAKKQSKLFKLKQKNPHVFEGISYEENANQLIEQLGRCLGVNINLSKRITKTF